jgi:hypothetical protein
MRQLERSDEEHEALASPLRRFIDALPLLLAPRLCPLGAILVQLAPAAEGGHPTGEAVI